MPICVLKLPKEVVITRGNRSEEVFFVEDRNNPLELSFNTLKDNGCSNMCITQESRDVLNREIQRKGDRKNADISDMSFMLIYTKPQPNKNKRSETFAINSRLKVIPLLLVTGPAKDINIITDRLHGAYRCFKRPVNLRDFLKKVRKLPMYWAIIDTIPGNTSCEI